MYRQSATYFREFYEVRATNDAVWWLLQGPEYMENISSRFLRKTSDQRKLRQPKCLLFNFLKKPVGTWWFGKIGVLVHFVTQNWKVNSWFVSVFSRGFFKGTRGNIFHIFRVQVSCKHSKDSVASKILMIYTSTCRLDIRAVGMLKIFVGKFKNLEQA